MGNVDKKVHGIRLSRQCQIKKKKTSISQPVEIHYGFISFFISLPLSQPGSAAHGCTHTHTHTLSYTPPPSTHTHSLIPFLSPLPFLSFSPSHYVSAPPFPFSIFSFSLCFLHLPSALPYSPHRSLSLSFVRSLTPSPFTRFLPPFIFLLPLSFLCVQSERGHYLSHTGHVRWNGGACNKYSRCKA